MYQMRINALWTMWIYNTFTFLGALNADVAGEVLKDNPSAKQKRSIPNGR
jgi:hypothetical protein